MRFHWFAGGRGLLAVALDQGIEWSEHRLDKPTQMNTSYVRWSDVAGTPVADPINEPWPGATRAQLLSLGIAVNRITEFLYGGHADRGGNQDAPDRRGGPGAPVCEAAHSRHGQDR